MTFAVVYSELRIETFVLLRGSNLCGISILLRRVSESAASGGTGHVREALGAGNSLGSSSLPLSVLSLDAKQCIDSEKLWSTLSMRFSGVSNTLLDSGRPLSEAALFVCFRLSLIRRLVPRRNRQVVDERAAAW